jgi:hypothetical protein
MIRKNLGGRLAHDNARHERHARHVAVDPKFVCGHVLVPDAQVAIEVVQHDGRKLFHRAALRDVLPDLVDRGDDLAAIHFGWIDDEVTRGHGVISQNERRELPLAQGL